MPGNSVERQREFKEKLYKAGLKQAIVWVRRKEPQKEARMTQRDFIINLNKLTDRWSADRLSQLYNLLIRIIRGKKEADKHKKA